MNERFSHFEKRKEKLFESPEKTLKSLHRTFLMFHYADTNSEKRLISRKVWIWTRTAYYRKSSRNWKRKMRPRLLIVFSNSIFARIWTDGGALNWILLLQDNSALVKESKAGWPESFFLVTIDETFIGWSWNADPQPGWETPGLFFEKLPISCYFGTNNKMS